jgi:hypothetical protein
MTRPPSSAAAPSSIGRPAGDLLPPGSRIAALCLGALALCAALYLLQGRIGFDVTDEGFLWYGAVATAHGQVPLRDFYAYDPGRYLWAAGWARLLGDGLLALRASTLLFAALGLACGLAAARRVVKSRSGLAAVGLLLALFLFPRHKLFEPSLALAAVLLGVRLLERPTIRRALVAGVGIGLAAFFGKNHGLYWGVAFLALLALVAWGGEGGRWRRFGRLVLAWSGGIVVGTLPLLAMFGAVPGFFRAYLDSILFFLVQGKTNAALAVPWPWRGSYAGLGLAAGAGKLALGLAFLLLLVVCAAAIVLSLRRPTSNLLAASGLVGAVYLHHVFSRADAAHLGQGIAPALLAALALLPAGRSARSRLGLALGVSLLAFLTLFAALPQSPFVRRVRDEHRGSPYATLDVAGDLLSLPADQAAGLAGIRREVSAHLPPGEPLLVLPYFPGLYPFLGRPSPIWDTYVIWPATQGSDERLIAQLERRGVRWALAGDYGVNAWPEFQAGHPVLAAWLASRFRPVPAPLLPPHFVLLLRQAPLGKLPGAVPLPAPSLPSR